MEIAFSNIKLLAWIITPLKSYVTRDNTGHFKPEIENML